MCKHSLPFSCLYCPPVVTTILVSSPMNELYFLTSYRWKCIMYLFASGFFHSAKCTKHLFVLLHISVFCFFSPLIYTYIVYWSIVDLQCFRYTAKWFSYTYTYILFLRLFSVVDYYNILTIVPCAI